MIKTTLKSIKATPAHDITAYSFTQCEELRAKTFLEVVYVSNGIYGVNGALLRDRNTNFTYKITARNSVLFYFV